MRCEWPSCKRERFLTEEDFTLHLNQHRDWLRARFVVPGACQWPGCGSKSVFETEASFNRHVKVHMKTRWCKFAGCKHLQGFPTKYDLDRHVKTHSKEHPFKCPDSCCFSHTQGFSRKDKLDGHIKVRHPHLMSIVESLRCDVHGCPTKTAFQTREELKEHFVTAHPYGDRRFCPVKGCAEHVESPNISAKLVEHIGADHGFTQCIFDHCDFCARKDLVARHILDDHMSYSTSKECQLPGCHGSRSQFNGDLFLAHLSDHHNIKRPDGSRYEVLSAAREGDTSYFSDGEFVACTHCSKSKTQPDKNEG
jgi:hypothetical protein